MLTNTSIKNGNINSSEINESQSYRIFSISTNISGENQNGVRNFKVGSAIQTCTTKQQISVNLLNCAKLITGNREEITYGQ